MRGLICFISLLILWAGIEQFNISTDLILLAIFGITSRKYWVK